MAFSPPCGGRTQQSVGWGAHCTGIVSPRLIEAGRGGVSGGIVLVLGFGLRASVVEGRVENKKVVEIRFLEELDER